MLTPSVTIPDRRTIVSKRRLIAELAKLVEQHGTGPALRPHVLSTLREALEQGRAEVRRRLEAGGSGTDCVHQNAYLMDQVIRALAEHTVEAIFPAANPT